MGKQSNAVASAGKKRGRWTSTEDKKLFTFVQQYGHVGRWRSVPEKAGLQRCWKSCRLRWRNYLNPDIKRGNFSMQENQTIIGLHALLGNRWSTIAAQLPKRTDNEIKNYWNSHLKKWLDKIGFDPVTHKPKTAILASTTSGEPKNLSNLSHIAQWESIRVQIEARLRKSKLLINCDDPRKSRPILVPQSFDMNKKAQETPHLLKSVLAGHNGVQRGGIGCTITQIGQEVGSFGNFNVDGVLSNCDMFEMPITNTSVMDFNGVFKESSSGYDGLPEALLLQQSHNNGIVNSGGQHGGIGCTVTQVGQEVGSFSNVDIEGVLSNYDQFEAPIINTLVMDFNGVFKESSHEYGGLLKALLLQQSHNNSVTCSGGQHGGIGCTVTQVEHEVGSFGNSNVEGMLSNYNQFEAPINNTSFMEFTGVFAESSIEYGELLEALLPQQNWI